VALVAVGTDQSQQIHRDLVELQTQVVVAAAGIMPLVGLAAPVSSSLNTPFHRRLSLHLHPLANGLAQ
jgi:hypothetical protein